MTATISAFQSTPVAEDVHAKTAAVTELLRTTLPAILDVSAAELFARSAETDRQYSGVIFGLYANAHGKSTYAEGVHQIAGEFAPALACRMKPSALTPAARPGLPEL